MPTKLADISQSTLGELVELAVERELVDFCYIASKVVVISIGGYQLSYPPDEARLFLRSLIQGWARARTSFEPGERGMGPGRVTLFPPAGREVPAEGEPAGQRGASRTGFAEERSTFSRSAGPRERPGLQVTSSEDYMDAVLSFAEAMRLIRGFDKDLERRRVTIHTQATTTEMSYFETLEYLTGSILHELRSKQP